MRRIEGLSLWDAFWFAVALNFTASCVGMLLVLTGRWDLGFLIPLICMALCLAFGLVALIPPRTRRLGGGSVLGVVVSVVGFLAVLTVIFVGYFIVGGNEIS